VIQQRKQFLVTNPRCTYDGINEQYFPFALLNEDGESLDTWDGGYDGNVPTPDYAKLANQTFYDEKESNGGDDRRRKMEALNVAKK